MPKTVMLKHDIAANWAKAVNFVPQKGEMIIYDDMDPPFKIGDGIRNVNDLPFTGNLSWGDFSISDESEVNV